MVINEEPSLTKRLRVGALKMPMVSLHTVRSHIAYNAYFILTGVAIIIAGSFFVFSRNTKAITTEMPSVVNQETQRYTACVFGKDITNPYVKRDFSVIVDHECKNTVEESMFAETEEDWFEQELREMLAGHPMEIMAESIAQQDKKVAGLIVGIARQESQWGVHAPSKSGVDCYNYWR